MPSLTFVVPCYNEEANVAATIANVGEAMRDFSYEFEIVVVDDGSSDGTLSAATAAARKDDRIKVIRIEVNRGFGAAYKVGVTHATKSHVMLIPGDNGFPKSSIKAVVELLGTADIVIPFVVNSASRGAFRHTLHVLFTLLINALFLNRIRYYNGPVVHRLDLLRGIPFETAGFGFQAEILTRLLVKGATFAEVPVTIQERSTGSSTAVGARTGWIIVKMIYRLLSEIGLFRRFRFPPAKWAREHPIQGSRAPRPQDRHTPSEMAE